MRDIMIHEMRFSCLSGHNIYVPSGYDSSTMRHLLSNTDVTIKAVNNFDAELMENKWRYFIERPIDIKSVTWPLDMVSLNEEQIGLVFRKRAFPKMEAFKKLLYVSSLLDWKRPEIKKLIRNLLSVFIDIHNGGYAYHSFDMNRMYYNEKTSEVLVEFSLGMSRHFRNIAHLEEVDVQEIAVEFLPPWVDFDARGTLSLSDDYYSIAALLFRLMIGRMPYEGRIMDGQGFIMDERRDLDPVEHIRMFRYYHKNPVFIFDEDDRTNSVGLYTNEDKFVERWEELPQTIRNMFIETFSKKHLNERYIDRRLYTVDEWLRALTDAEIL